MAKGKRRRRKTATQTPRIVPGLSPGTLVANPNAPQPVVTLIAYKADEVVEKKVEDLASLSSIGSEWHVAWVNIEGLGDAQVITTVGELFGIHQLALEDVMSSHQRAKLEQYGEDLFLISHMIELQEELLTEQVSFFISEGLVITFQDGPLDCFERVRDRIRRGLGKIRTQGSDYLAYALLDALIDCYFPVLEKYGERLELLEDEIIEKASRTTIAKVHEVKRGLLVMRRAIWPLRDAISLLLKDSSPIFKSGTLVFLRDCHDHAVQICDLIETFRELGSDMMDVYLSSASNRLGEGMKLLTIITTICAPPTVVAGIYGMNFKTEVSPYNMPELSWYFGYPFALGVMFFFIVITTFIFWTQGWMSSQEKI